MPTENMIYFLEAENTLEGKDKEFFVHKVIGSLSVLCPEEIWKEAVDIITASYDRES